MITSLDQLDLNGIYTYADYLTWQFEERVELLKGYVRQMAAPNRKHQQISGSVYSAFRSYLRKNQCGLYYAPFDVRLFRYPNEKTENQIYTVVQPDLCIICDLEKLDDRGCIGAPDLIVEIVSPSNAKRDMEEKFELYQQIGLYSLTIK
jgi:Uma2 family endonuclease